MIGIALLVIILVLAVGLLLIYWSSQWESAWVLDTADPFPSTWWSKSQALWLCAQGILLALAFMVLANLVFMLASSTIISNASVTDRVFSKAGLANDGTWLQPIFNAIKTTEDGRYENRSETHENNRKAFLAAYLVDPDKAAELETKDELKLLEAVIRERPFEKDNSNNVCSSGLEIFMVQWLTVASNASKIPSMGDGMLTSCDDFLDKLVGAGNQVCELREYGKQATETIRRAYGVNWIRDLSGLIGLDGAPSSPREVLKSLEEGITLKPIGGNTPEIAVACDAQLMSNFDNHPYAREVLLAQLTHLRSSMGGIYRAKALIWGPLQWLLLASFFAGCLALGQRRSFGRNIDSQKPCKTHLHLFVEYRLNAVKEDMPPEDLRLGIFLIERAAKNAINEELDDDASFPIDLVKYLLPTVGFIGTVIGIAASMDSSGGVVEASTQGVEAQLSAISVVTGQLGVAFDTTLLALAATSFVIFGHAYRRSCERRVVREIKMELIKPKTDDK
ncbi:MotA/TolQ/ExbB proton channel family protein [Vibrio parahaemolyticus]|uniref:MotA/TolQ/ExbB proton channel family protein n=1 Tax=Vibrio parahaemolyticus TaxID=670 RepID=UPI003299CD3E